MGFPSATETLTVLTPCVSARRCACSARLFAISPMTFWMSAQALDFLAQSLEFPPLPNGRGKRRQERAVRLPCRPPALPRAGQRKGVFRPLVATRRASIPTRLQPLMQISGVSGWRHAPSKACMLSRKHDSADILVGAEGLLLLCCAPTGRPGSRIPCLPDHRPSTAAPLPVARHGGTSRRPAPWQGAGERLLSLVAAPANT